jgi:hypothetical protein
MTILYSILFHILFILFYVYRLCMTYNRLNYRIGDSITWYQIIILFRPTLFTSHTKLALIIDPLDEPGCIGLPDITIINHPPANDH